MSSYVDTLPQEAPAGGLCMGYHPGHSWAEFTRRRLDWLYGVERSTRIATGNDPKTQADLAAWSNLGERAAA